MHGVGEAELLGALFAHRLSFEPNLRLLLRSVRFFLKILLTNSCVQMADAMKNFSSGLCCDTSLLAEEFWCVFK